MPSFEGVLSPSLSVENDSNHSSDVPLTTPDLHSMNAITEESRQETIIEPRTDSCSAFDVEMGHQSSEGVSQSDYFAASTPQSLTSGTVTKPEDTITTNPSTMDCDNTITKKDILSPIETGLIPVDSIDELPPLTIECVSQEPPVIVSTSSSTKVAKKKATTTEASSG